MYISNPSARNQRHEVRMSFLSIYTCIIVPGTCKICCVYILIDRIPKLSILTTVQFVKVLNCKSFGAVLWNAVKVYAGYDLNGF